MYFDILGYKEKMVQYGDALYLGIIDTVIQSVLGKLKFLNYEWELDEYGIDEEDNFSRRHHQVKYRVFSEIQQCLLICHKTFIRGSIVIGNICFTDNYVFGSGLISSYLLENDIALFPRIILDDECMYIFRG